MKPNSTSSRTTSDCTVFCRQFLYVRFLTVRAGAYELVVGARRFRASKASRQEYDSGRCGGISATPDAEKIQLIENLQRDEIHELDEGIGYRSLMDLKPDFYTVEMVAAQVGQEPVIR